MQNFFASAIILLIEKFKTTFEKIMVIYFDTETTGLTPGRIIQLSYILDDGIKPVGKNFYFAVEYIDPSAVAVHGISLEKLAVLSGAHTFSEYAEEIYDDFANASLIIAHNIKFDLNFMMAEFRYMDRIFRYQESLDSMKYFTPIMKITKPGKPNYKYPKLVELTEFADIYPYDVTRGIERIFGSLSAGGFHAADFDATALYLAMDSLKDRYPELKELLDRYL